MLLSPLLSMLGWMDAQGVLAQNGTYRQSKLCADCQSSLTIVVLTEKFAITLFSFNPIAETGLK